MYGVRAFGPTGGAEATYPLFLLLPDHIGARRDDVFDRHEQQFRQRNLEIGIPRRNCPGESNLLAMGHQWKWQIPICPVLPAN